MINLSVSIGNSSYEEIIKIVKKYPFYELRIDLLKITVEQLKTILNKNNNAIITFREKNNFISQKKMAFILTAIDCKAKFIDLEFEINNPQLLLIIRLIEKSKTAIIVSYHEENENVEFEKIKEIKEKIIKINPNVIKIVTNYKNKKLINETLNLNDFKTIAFSMKDTFSRLISIKKNAPFTYVSPDGFPKTVLTQISFWEAQKLLSKNKFSIYGVLGKPISHSLSPNIFNSILNKNEKIYLKILDDNYQNFLELTKKLPIKAVNVTKPYKKDCFNFGEIKSDEVNFIKAANCLLLDNNYVDNTDWKGVQYALEDYDLKKFSNIIILGAGGATKAVLYAVKDYKEKIFILNRTLEKAENLAKKYECNFKSLSEFKNIIKDNSLIINTTPLEITDFINRKNVTLLDADYYKKENYTHVNYISGKKWLVGQALPFAKKIFNSEKIFFNDYRKSPEKISLIGFMGAGKSVIGKILSEKLDWEWIDTDKIIEKNEKKSITEIFESKGESYFRELETNVLNSIVKKSEIVISTGGGILNHKINRDIISKNFYNYWIFRDISETFDVIFSSDRPLIENFCKFTKLFYDRLQNYSQIADVLIFNKTILKTIDNIYEDFVAYKKLF